jgi:GDP-L-fucose synthase
LLRKTHEAKMASAESIEIWGTGAPLREFLHVDDLADACVFLMENYDSGEPVNIGAGTDLSIRDLALLIKEVVGYHGEIRFNPEKPDGTPRKLLDVSKIQALGWKPSIPLREGLESTYRWYVENEGRSRK